MRLLLTLQYLGTRYAGWQTQANAVGVQQVLEETLSKVCGAPLRVHGAGRTDSGVHASGQRAHFDLETSITLEGLIKGVNDRLPSDIRIVAAREVPPEFHARFDARSKSYRYQIWNGAVADVFLAPTHAHVHIPLDETIMSRAASALVGTHDFRSYTVAEPEVSSTVRTIETISVVRRGEAIWIEVTADGFLRFMVRRIAGQLIEIGRRKIAPEAAEHALEPAFSEARWTAPAEGLILTRVGYDDPTL